ncbi:MAG: UbiX family flavin prenyltransferase [Dehalococcoidia bacterium]|jgi:4-hydroxy-3-polyprenylbenzoate decarboxylase
MKADKVVIVAITGASGAIYGIRLLEVLSGLAQMRTHLVISSAAEITVKHETCWDLHRIKALATCCYDVDAIEAAISSGSFRRDAMVIAPCSVKTLSAVANSYADNLITRAADVTLKERGRLILLVRETPLHLGHLKNMVAATEMGAVILPPVPAFYHHPKGISEIVDQTVGKVLDLLEIENKLFERWDGAKILG